MTRIGQIVRFKEPTTLHKPDKHQTYGGCPCVDTSDSVIVVGEPFRPDIGTRSSAVYNEVFVLAEKGLFLVDEDDLKPEKLLYWFEMST